MAEAQLAQLSSWLANGGSFPINILGFIDDCQGSDGCWGAIEHQAQLPQESPTWWGLEAFRAELDEDLDTECEENEAPFVTAGLDSTCPTDDPCPEATP